ncbi:GNAT family N-acetyltransferase [Nocardioides sp. W7]|uniref:GNAT family N-acetyltransferase n=1 Tax=Nocardioides sp. W7 TaxID=2931390 RepID=UPI001FD14CEE|nr:GNAT family N-acetyltransferase [Nocardioides sp. W7]
MDASTAASLDRWWAELFGLEPDEMWDSVTVTPHGRLQGYPGWYVAWRAAGVHVSAPGPSAAEEVASFTELSPHELQDVAFWDAFAHQHGLVLVGPSTHAYLDRDPGPDLSAELVDGHGVALVGPAALADLRAQVTEEEWSEAGFDEEPETCFGLRQGGALVAAANLTDWDGTPRDVGVLVSPAARGRGLAEVVGRHAASWSVRRHGLARWTARTTNIASVRTAERLGFTPYVTQLALSPVGD